MTKIRVAINGFGRIGRAFFKVALNSDKVEVVAVNDLGSLDNLAYLLKYDTAYGQSPFDIKVADNNLVVNQQKISFTQEREPSQLPWKEHQIDVVVEATGVFRNYQKAKGHLKAGAKKVVITAPVKDDVNNETATILSGVNEEKAKTCTISSNASCTTNAASPVIGILKSSLGIDKALLNTVHSYTATQGLVDSPHKDWRKGRAAAQNIVPTSTGAAIATTLAHTDLANQFDGIALRVPTAVGSIADITFIAKRDTSVEEVNQILTEAAKTEKWKKIFTVTDDEIVSSDIIGAPYASIVDLKMTRVIGNLVKVLAWYDNEVGYVHTLLNHVQIVANNTKEQG